MFDKPDEFLQGLLNAQEISPALRASYQDELKAIRQPQLTWQKALPGIILLVTLVIGTLGIVRNMFVYEPGTLTMIAWAVLACSFSWVSFLIVRDLWRWKHSPKAAFSIGHILMTAGGSITVVSLLLGLQAPSDPASMFNAFFVFVFYFACFTLALENRFVAAELAAKEQMLRIEYRLADLAERLEPSK